ncbi:hypothetical protein D3C77_644870 [compost metagenome]
MARHFGDFPEDAPLGHAQNGRSLSFCCLLKVLVPLLGNTRMPVRFGAVLRIGQLISTLLTSHFDSACVSVGRPREQDVVSVCSSLDRTLFWLPLFGAQA